MAGLLHHAGALTALCSPTVNCYRRLHAPWAPAFLDWGLDNRLAALRFRAGPSALLESRFPSSAANPYLAVAATVAAGLDGVDRAMPVVGPNSRELGPVPRSLGQAVEALKQDEVMCSALGEQFIEWFGTVKLEEMGKVGQVDAAVDRKAELARERKMYFELV